MPVEDEVREEVEEGLRQHAALVDWTYAKIAELFQSKGEEFENEDVEKLQTGDIPEMPSFPFLILLAGISKDAFDVADLTGVGVIATFFLWIVLTATLTFWTWGKISGGWWKKRIIKWMWTRLILCVTIEMIPFLHMFVPANTIYILMAHYKEKKIVILFNEALEILHKSGIAKGPRFRA